MKRTLILIGSLVFIVLMCVIGFILGAKNRKVETPIVTAGPTPIQIQSKPTGTVPLSVVSTNPDNQQKNIPTNQQLTITFNRLFTQDEISFTSWPIFTFTTKIQGKNLIITPNTSLKPNTVYVYYINYKAPVIAETRTFSTVGDNPSAPNTYVRTGSPNDPYHGVESPDLYLSNRTPYTGTTFSVVNDFTSTPQDHFFFTVSLTGPDQNQDKQDFITWLKSLGFSDANIQTLDIRYN